MFKKGFTLAEVLVTLGIIGVVSAMTLPTLKSNTNAQSIGPKLAKAAATFELANKALLTAQDVESISEGAILTNITNYVNLLSNHIHITSISYDNTPTDTMECYDLSTENAFSSKEGFIYFVNSSSETLDMSNPPHKRLVGFVYVDINGNAKPNRGGTDIFGFTLWDDGSLRPAGGQEWKGSNSTTWRSTCEIDKEPTNRIYCTGHIFENNLKVRYKM